MSRMSSLHSCPRPRPHVSLPTLLFILSFPTLPCGATRTRSGNKVQPFVAGAEIDELETFVAGAEIDEPETFRATSGGDNVNEGDESREPEAPRRARRRSALTND